MFIFRPRTVYIGCSCTAYSVKRTFITVSRIGHVIHPFVLHYKCPLIHPGPYHLPRLRNMNTGSHGFTFNLKQIICKLGNPDIQSVVEPIEKKIRLSIVIYKEGIVDTFLIRNHRFLLFLFKRTQGRFGRCHTDVLVGRIIHIEGTIHQVYFRRPEPTVGPHIFLIQSQSVGQLSRSRPRFKIIRHIHLNPFIRVGTIRIIGSLVQ